VKPTKSQNNTETTLRSSKEVADGASVSAAPQALQKRDPSGTSLPQLGQIATSRV